jgi:hypothetical protein
MSVSVSSKPGWLTVRLAGMGLSRGQFAVILMELGAAGSAATIAQRLRRWDACETPVTDEALAFLTLLGRVRGALDGVCGSVPARRSGAVRKRRM